MQQHPSIQSHDRKRRILLVEYDAASRDTLVHILQEEYEILTANRGEKALAALDEHSADLSLVLLDLKLPDMNGMEILRIIRENPEYSGIPVIVLTADQEDIASVREGDQFGNNIVDLYNPLLYIGAEETEDPVWTRIVSKYLRVFFITAASRMISGRVPTMIISLILPFSFQVGYCIR